LTHAYIIDEHDSCLVGTWGWHGQDEYLPMKQGGHQVLVRVDSSIWKVVSPATTEVAKGLKYRKSKQLDDENCQREVERWGSFVAGTETCDGWFQETRGYMCEIRVIEKRQLQIKAIQRDHGLISGILQKHGEWLLAELSCTDGTQIGMIRLRFDREHNSLVCSCKFPITRRVLEKAAEVDNRIDGKEGWIGTGRGSTLTQFVLTEDENCGEVSGEGLSKNGAFSIKGTLRAGIYDLVITNSYSEWTVKLSKARDGQSLVSKDQDTEKKSKDQDTEVHFTKGVIKKGTIKLVENLEWSRWQTAKRLVEVRARREETGQEREDQRKEGRKAKKKSRKEQMKKRAPNGVGAEDRAAAEEPQRKVEAEDEKRRTELLERPTLELPAPKDAKAALMKLQQCANEDFLKKHGLTSAGKNNLTKIQTAEFKIIFDDFQQNADVAELHKYIVFDLAAFMLNHRSKDWNATFKKT